MPRAKSEPPQIEPTYGPLVPCCKAFGLSKTVSFRLVRDGLLESVMIGGRRFVMLDSLRTLPERLKAEAANGGAA